MRLHRIAAILAACALAGCSGLPTAVTALTPGQLADATRGTILVSTAAVSRCTATGSWAPIYDAATHKLAAGSPVVPIDEHSTSDYPDRYGTLSALSLPPGHYLMTVESTNPTVGDIVVPSFAFDVVAGRTRYLGSLSRLTPCERAGLFKVIDRYDVDVELATRLNPALRGHAPERALMEFAGSAAEH